MELEHLLSKVLMTDKDHCTYGQLNLAGWLQVVLKLLWACAVLYVTFPVDHRSRLFDQKLVCSCKKTRLRKGYVTQRCFEWCSLTVYLCLEPVLKEHNQASQRQFINYEITLILFTLQNQIRNFCRNNFDHVYQPNIKESLVYM